MSIETTRYKHTCPTCHAQHDAMTGADTPKPGDLVLCISCECWLVLIDSGVRVLRDGEWLALPKEQRRFMTELRDRLLKVKIETGVRILRDGAS